MSYRNPQIIQDRSGEILAKGISQGMAGLAKGIQTLGAKREAERKKKIEDAKQFSRDSMKIAREQAASNSKTNKNLTKLVGNINGISDYMGQLTEEIGELKMRELQGTSTQEDANNIIYAQGEQDKINSGVKLTLGYAGTPNIENPLQAGNGQYIKEDENGSIDANRAFHFGLKSVEGFSIEYPTKEVDGIRTQYVKATDSDGNSYEKAWDDYVSDLTEGGYVIDFPSVQVELQEDQTEALYDKEGNFLNNLTIGQDEKTIIANGFKNKEDFNRKSKVSTVNDEGKDIIENRQYLNKLSIQKARERLRDTTFSKVTYAETNRQALSRALIDLNIYDSEGPMGVEEWLSEDMTDEMKKKAVRRSTDKTWETTLIKEDSEGRYYRVTNSYSPESPDSPSAAERTLAAYNEFSTNIQEEIDGSTKETFGDAVKNIVSLGSTYGKHTIEDVQYGPNSLTIKTNTIKQAKVSGNTYVDIEIPYNDTAKIKELIVKAGYKQLGYADAEAKKIVQKYNALNK